MMSDCIFCKIIAGLIPSYKIYEDEQFIVILDIFPAVSGQALVFPKQHIGSYVFDMQQHDYQALMAVTQKAAKRMDVALQTLRTCMVMEGMEVDHAHIKLYPIYEIGSHTATQTADLSIYPGFLTTLHGEPATEAALLKVKAKFDMLVIADRI